MIAEPAPVAMWLSGPIEPAAQTAIDRLARTSDVLRVAVMPDVHVATEFCVGTVVATSHTLFPMAVGGDIGCGMLALRFGASAELLRDRQRAAEMLAALYEVCPARRHHRKLAPAMPADFLDAPLSAEPLDAWRRGEARLQLGTLGAGNHFLEFQADEATDDLWLMIHTGSRNLGQLVLQHHLPKCAKTATGLFALGAGTPAGESYLADVAVARAYASANRRALALAAAGALERLFHVSPLLDSLIDVDHNHVRLETHDTRPVFVHRKGATLASLATPGVIPGSMAGPSFHTEGRGHAPALDSCSHGAGRAMSRAKAREKVRPGDLKQQLKNVWFDHRLAPHLREESPAAYKPIREVMHAQDELVKIVRTLRPVLCYKGV